MNHKLGKIGFSLLELIIALAIVVITAAIAIPSYQSHLLKVRRTDGEAALLSLAANLERHYLFEHSYANVKLADLGVSEYSSEHFYRLEITAQTENTFQLQAIPQGSQQQDTACGTLGLSSTGEKSVTGTQDLQICWGSN